MKLYISADIEGITGAAHWDETQKDKKDYDEFQQQMTAEVVAACEGAFSAGAKEIWLKDAHSTGRNIIADKLPDDVKLIRGWSGHPYMMLQELNDTFDAVAMIGYHSGASAAGSPLEHTMSSRFSSIKINGRSMTEFHINAYTAALNDVPVVFASGDQNLCNQINTFNPHIVTYSTMQCIGSSTVSLNPKHSLKKIWEGMREALSGNFDNCQIELPDCFEVEIKCKDHMFAYQNSFYPGAKLGDDGFTLIFKTRDYFEVLKMLLFTVSI